MPATRSTGQSWHSGRMSRCPSGSFVSMPTGPAGLRPRTLPGRSDFQRTSTVVLGKRTGRCLWRAVGWPARHLAVPGDARSHSSLRHQGSCLPPRDPSAYNILYVELRIRGGGSLMKTMTYSESRAHYAQTLDAVVDDREEVVITRAGHEPVVIVALADYESLKETAYLLRSPENARRLLASIDRLEHGGGIERDLLE